MDKKVIEELARFYVEANIEKPFHLLGAFAEIVALSRQEPGGAIEDIAKCFRYQFDEAELASLIKELSKGKI